MNKAILLTGILFLLGLFQLTAQEAAGTAFADHLRMKGEYYRAITEYERFLFQGSANRDDSLYAGFQIARCYLEGGQPDSTLRHSLELLKQFPGQEAWALRLNQLLGMANMDMDYPSLGLFFFRKNPGEPLSDLLAGFCCFQLGDKENARQYFAHLSSSGIRPYDQMASEALALVDGKSKFTSRKPWLAVLLSGMVPGAGYFYTGHYQSGFAALLLNGLLAGTALEFRNRGYHFASLATMTLAITWYIGNMTGAWDAAQKRNELEFERLRERITGPYSFLFPAALP